MSQQAARRISDVRKLIGDNLGSGIQRISQMKFRWNIAGNCSAPYSRTIWARPTEGEGLRPKWATVAPGREHTLELELETRCRKCENCRMARASEWRVRARAELAIAPRTWFGTLTLRPEVQYHMLSLARHRLAIQGIDFDSLDFGEQFVLRHNEIAREITKMIKRVRKLSAAKFKYLVIAEAHKSGAPHYHILIHECDTLTVVRKSVLDAQWKLGFCQWRLVPHTKPWQGAYITKYLSKSLAARVRASQGYGRLSTDVLEHRRTTVGKSCKNRHTKKP